MVSGLSPHSLCSLLSLWEEFLLGKHASLSLLIKASVFNYNEKGETGKPQEQAEITVSRKKGSALARVGVCIEQKRAEVGCPP